MPPHLVLIWVLWDVVSNLMVSTDPYFIHSAEHYISIGVLVGFLRVVYSKCTALGVWPMEMLYGDINIWNLDLFGPINYSYPTSIELRPHATSEYWIVDGLQQITPLTTSR